jgi:hypothetical protein
MIVVTTIPEMNITISLFALFFSASCIVLSLIESFTPRFDELFELTQVIAMECADANGEQEEEGFWNAVCRGEKFLSSSDFSHLSAFTQGLLDRLLSSNKTAVFERSPVTKDEAEQTDALR